PGRPPGLERRARVLQVVGAQRPGREAEQQRGAERQRGRDARAEARAPPHGVGAPAPPPWVLSIGERRTKRTGIAVGTRPRSRTSRWPSKLVTKVMKPFASRGPESRT